MDSSISVRTPETKNGGCPELILTWRGNELRFASDAATSFSIGLDRDGDLVVPGTYASRQHATLQWRRKSFELIDHSTNGTFVQLEDEQVSHVHRRSVRLWGSGFLSFGEPLTLENALKFDHA